MTIDALALAAICSEAGELIRGCRIQKLIPTGPLSMAIEVYNPQVRRRVQLILSADAQIARFHLLNQKASQMPGEPTPFLLVLRRYIRSGIITSLEQAPFERIVTLSIAKKFPAGKRPQFNPMGGPVRREAEDEEILANDDELEEAEIEGEDFEIYESKLVCEIMGRHSNLILLSEDGVIIDAIKRVASGRNRYRTILPHFPYVAPPPQEKLLFNLESPASFNTLMNQLGEKEPDKALWQALVETFKGVSPQAAREANYRFAEKLQPEVEIPEVKLTLGKIHNWDKLYVELKNLLRPLAPEAALAEIHPTVVRETDGDIKAFAPYELRQFKPDGLIAEPVDSISTAADEFYSQTESIAGQTQRKQEIAAMIANHLEKLQRRANSQTDSLKRAESADELRRKGEAIYVHIYEITTGMKELVAEGLKIKLDPDRSPSDNAQAYFKEYEKARKAMAGVPELLADTRLELDYLDEMLTQLELAENFEEVVNIKAELVEAGYGATAKDSGKAPGKSKKRKRLHTPTFTSSEGFTIYVGKSAQHNEYVTFELGDKLDMWLHARGMPGSHVIIKSAGKDIPEKTLLEAAALAGYYSKGQRNNKVEVTYAPQKYLRKIKGAHPGLVTYINDKSVSVKPKKLNQKVR